MSSHLSSRLSDLSTPQVLAILAALLLFIYQFSFKLLLSPAKYKEAVTLRAAHDAFKEDVGSDGVKAKELVPYKRRWVPGRLMNLYAMKLHRNAPVRFQELRRMWGVDEEEYKRETLGKWSSLGTVGLSGSLFFHSDDNHFLLKSLGRTFENHFLHAHFLPAYFDYVKENPRTMINKIFDMLYSFDHRIGEWIKASPSHYIILENIAFDKKDDWEMFDLKPTSYVEPYRDLVPERLQLSGVTDVLPPSKPLLMSSASRAEHLSQIRKDLNFLADLGCVDYSVLVVRPPDGHHCRLALIDVFWSLKEPRAKLTKKASDTIQLPQQTVTADAHGYADECYNLVEGAIVTHEMFEERNKIKSDVVLVDV